MHVSIFERKTIAPTLLGHFLDYFFFAFLFKFLPFFKDFAYVCHFMFEKNSSVCQQARRLCRDPKINNDGIPLQ